MADKLIADNNGDIYVEADYNNIILVDPNKTVDNLGKISERLIDHENLVMFANLEAYLLPRTKLAVGFTPQTTGQQTISIAKMNFLKPTNKDFLTDGYYDELTGKDTASFKGQNQKQEIQTTDQLTQKVYYENKAYDLQNITDNGLLGMTSIKVDVNTSFIPNVTIELEDVQGKGLFELGGNSPYAAFFNLPYCPFYLTLKGYYGQAIRYELNLQKFNARFNTISGNYQITLKFLGYKYNILNEISIGHLLATPHMYNKRFDVAKSETGPQPASSQAYQNLQLQGLNSSQPTDSQYNIVEQLISEKGYLKIVEVYSEYKAKGLLAPNFPELTLIQLMNKLQMFIQNIQNNYEKQDFLPLTNIRSYQETLGEYFGKVRVDPTSWFNTYINPQPIVLKDNIKVYGFKANLDTAAREFAITQLKSIITDNNKILSENVTLGSNSKTEIKNKLSYDNIAININQSSVDWLQTTRYQTGIINPSKQQIIDVTKKYENLFNVTFEVDATDNNIIPAFKKIVPLTFFVFEGENRFDNSIKKLDADASKKLSEYETELSAKLVKKLENYDSGIGFKPTVRNIVGVIMASAEAFIRLLDDVHTSAWNVKYDPVRKSAILNNPSSATNVEKKQLIQISTLAFIGNQLNTALKEGQQPVYPWPQFFVETSEDKKGRFQLKYIADPSVVDITQGYLYDKWPEVEFVEEYIKGLFRKADIPNYQPPSNNDTSTFLINYNAIEYPEEGIAYVNKEEVKYFYEMWERQIISSHYSGFIRTNLNQRNSLINLNTEVESNNIEKSLGVSSPFLSLKIKELDYNSADYQEFLKTISNEGTGKAYQDYIRDFYVTPYLKVLTENSFSILSISNLGKDPQNSPQSKALSEIVSSALNEPIIVDTFPFTYPGWNLNNMSLSSKNVGNDVYNTNKVLKVFEYRNVISNFTDLYDYTTNRPVTNFSYLSVSNPTGDLNTQNLADFYGGRTPKNFIPSEGYMYSSSPKPNFPGRTTTSILNTPFFVNAIQNGVDDFRSNKTYPFVQAAYLFLNSLPLASLRERYQTLNNKDLDYIASCFKKFGGIHKVPYAWVLKMGSIWHRYKVYVDSGVDIISSAWKDFDYVGNYSPIENSKTQEYFFQPTPMSDTSLITLQTESLQGITIQTGFYPKVINDFNVFLNGFELFSGYTSEELQMAVNGGMKLYTFEDSSIYAFQKETSISVRTWSVVLPNELIDTMNGDNCIPANNTKLTDYFVIPSFGSNVNQTKSECIEGTNTIVNLSNNQSMYNGSVRVLWGSPNYGYFNNDEIRKPDYDSYLNLIYVNDEELQPMFLLNSDDYSKIEEIFSVFDKSILDKFEIEFLNFCKPIINNESTIELTTPIGGSPVNIDISLRNFQLLFRNLMKVPPQGDGMPNQEYFTNCINDQLKTFSNGIVNFLQSDVVLRYGNPSNYRRRVFDSFISTANNPAVVNPIIFKPYVQESLPTLGGLVTVQQSKQRYPKEWKALETEVGFSTINGLRYTNNGSYITDFFITNNIEFSVDNIILCSPLIKMFATQKLKNNNITSDGFKQSISEYVNQLQQLRDEFFDDTMTKVRKDIAPMQPLPEKTIASAIDGQMNKSQLYESFKSLNDKWIAGGDFKSKTLFEDFLFLDRASRNIGDIVLIDILSLERSVLNLNSLSNDASLTQSVYSVIENILRYNKITPMPMPAYVNFYNIRNVDGIIQPNSQNSFDFANSLWGTYLDVDYRSSGPKMVCTFDSYPSANLDIQNDISRFNDDSIDLTKTNHPLIEDQTNKTDWNQSNKCVGFTVDIGVRNQNVFQSFNVSQDNGFATSESIDGLLSMINQYNGQYGATQNYSVYNYYKTRSYQCNVTSLGNAMLQPMMYFNLRHVPMFNGAYLITSVQHSIKAGDFQTSFAGTRQSIYDVGSIDQLLTNVNLNLLTNIYNAVKNKKDDTNASTTSQQTSAGTPQKADSSPNTTNSCSSNINSNYSTYIVEPATVTTINQKTLADFIKTKTFDKDIQTIVYQICYVKTFQPQDDSGKFIGYNNNYATISLSSNYGETSKYFSPSYSCVNLGGRVDNATQTEPLVAFSNLDFFITFMISRLENRISQIKQIGLSKFLVCYWTQSSTQTPVTESYYDSNQSNYTTLEESVVIANKSAISAGLSSFVVVPTGTSGTSGSSGTSGTSGTCPPPTISSFKPLSGKTGTLVTVSGTHLDYTTGATVNNIEVTNFTILNEGQLRIQIPNPTQTSIPTGKILIRTTNGSTITTTNFTFTP